MSRSMLGIVRKISSAVCAVLMLASISPVTAQTLPQASLGWSVAYSAPQIPMASDMNLWKRAGVDMKIATFGSGREAFEALLGGQLDFVLAAELPAVTGAMKSQSFTIVADLSRFRGNLIIANFPAASASDLAGKKVGTTLGTSSEFLLFSALQRAGVQAEIVNAAPSDLLPALLRGDISAATLFPNSYPAAKKALGDRYHELRVPEETHLILLATRDVTSKRPDVVRATLRALMAADKVIKENPALAQDRIVQGVDGQVTLDQLKAVWPQYDFECRLDQNLVDLMTLEGGWIAQRGMIKDVAVSKQLFQGFIDDAPLKALAPTRVSLH